jgi:hypothetical protein
MHNICTTSLRDDKQENPLWSKDVHFQDNSGEISRADSGTSCYSTGNSRIANVDIETGIAPIIAGTEPLSWEEIAELEVNRGVGGGAEILLSNTLPDVPQGNFRKVPSMVKAGPIDVLQVCMYDFYLSTVNLFTIVRRNI